MAVTQSVFLNSNLPSSHPSKSFWKYCLTDKAMSGGIKGEVLLQPDDLKACVHISFNCQTLAEDGLRNKLWPHWKKL